MSKNKIVTSFYSNLYGTKFGGRPYRNGHYKWSLLSLLKMTDAEFICYTSEEEYDDICDFFYKQFNVFEDHLTIVKYDLNQHYFLDLFEKYKNYEEAKNSDRCIEIQYMKYIWANNIPKEYDKVYWIDAGLSHCGLIPNKYLSPGGPTMQGYYECPLFNNSFLKNLNIKSDDKFLIVGKENHRNFWSGTVNQKHFNNYDNSVHVIGGLFGGNQSLWSGITEMFEKYVIEVTEDAGRLYHEEDIMTLMYRNHPDLFVTLDFDTWYHPDAPIPGLSDDHFTANKSFFRILEELQ
jgi:hypothetical protein